VAAPIDCEWKELREQLASAWAKSTRLANFLVGELSKADVVRSPGMVRMPKAPNPYLYPLARALIPSLASQSVVALCNTVQRKYNEMRIAVIWRGEASLQRFRYPVPYPIPSQGWKASYLSETEKVPIVRVRFDQRTVHLRLRGGHEFRRQLGAFAQIVGGEAVPCQMAIYRKRVTESDSRPGVTSRENGGGTKAIHRIMVKLVAWLPRSARCAGANSTMLVKTSAHEFWCAVVEGREPWILNADHVRGWIAAHNKRISRLSQDTKYEKRIPERMRRQINDRLSLMSQKQHDRLATWNHTATAMLVGFAQRQKVMTVEYNDTDKTYLPSFPWFDLRTKLQQKLEAAGIGFKHASAEVPSENADALAAERTE
jgi:hypothetical protein